MRIVFQAGPNNKVKDETWFMELWFTRSDQLERFGNRKSVIPNAFWKACITEIY